MIRMLRTTTLAGIMALAAAIAPGQNLAVPGKTPANPDLIVSIPSTPALWGALSATPISGLLGPMSQPAGGIPAELKALEGEIGLKLDPADFFTETLSGLDIYYLTINEYPGFVANLAFQDALMPGKIIDQLKKDAAGSSGSSAGIGADTIVESSNGRTRILSLPAFEIYLAADENVLVWSNLKLGLDSAVSDEGRALFASEFFKRSMDSLSKESGQAWAFGDVTAYQAALASATPPVAGTVTPTRSSSAYKLQIGKDFAKLSSFTHQDDMPMAKRRYAMTSPPAGAVPITSYFSSDSLLTIGTNHFDGLAILETSLDTLSSIPNSPVKASQIEENLKASRASLGFDVRNDLLANLGPALGLDIIKADASNGGTLDLVLVSAVKDVTRFKNVVAALEKLAEGMPAAPKEGEPAAKPGEAAKTTAVAERETWEGIEITSYSFLTGLAGLGGVLSPAFAITEDNHFVLAISKDTLKSAITRGKAGKGGILSSDKGSRIAKLVDEDRNSLVTLDIESLVAGFAAAIDSGVPTAGATPEQSKALLAFVKALKFFGMGTSYRDNGEKHTMVILM